MTELFNPNAQPILPDHRWGSYCPRHTKNRPHWKTHATLRAVRSAIDVGETIQVYERVTGTWWHRGTWTRQEQPPIPAEETCHVCGKEATNSWNAPWACWSPDADFERVWCHLACRRKLGVRRG